MFEANLKWKLCKFVALNICALIQDWMQGQAIISNLVIFLVP